MLSFISQGVPLHTQTVCELLLLRVPSMSHARSAEWKHRATGAGVTTILYVCMACCALDTRFCQDVPSHLLHEHVVCPRRSLASNFPLVSRLYGFRGALLRHHAQTSSARLNCPVPTGWASLGSPQYSQQLSSQAAAERYKHHKS